MAERKQDEVAERKRKIEIERLEVEEQLLKLKKAKLDLELSELTKSSSDVADVGQKKSEETSDIVELNVGGQIFATFADTLLQYGSTYFYNLLERGDCGGIVRGSRRDASNRIFIDRPPEPFRVILSYLRGGTGYKNAVGQEKEELISEAEFYGLTDLADKLRRDYRGYDPSVLSSADQDMRRAAQEIREQFAAEEHSARIEAAAKAEASLIDIFDDAGNLKQDCTPPEEYPNSFPSSPDATLLFQKQATYARNNYPVDPPPTLTEFRSRLVNIAGPMFEEFPLDNVVIAGGAVMRALTGRFGDTGREGEFGDTDLFLVANSEQEAREIYDRILGYFGDPSVRQRAGFRHHQLLVARSAFAVTIVAGCPPRPVQIILARHCCAAEIIYNYDVDSCQFYYDGARVRATPSGHRAWMTGVNVADPERRSGNYEKRLAKHASRGFLVAVPGLDLERVQKKYFRDNFFAIIENQMRRVYLVINNDKDHVDDGEVMVATAGSEKIFGLSKLLVYSNLSPTPTLQNGMDKLDHCLRHRHLRYEFEQMIPFAGSDGEDQHHAYLIKLYDRSERSRAGSPRARATPDDATPDDYLRFFQHLNENSDGHPICCFDMISDVRSGLNCPEVEDAQPQLWWRNAVFSSDTAVGKLTRRLEFPLATKSMMGHWCQSGEAGWTDGTYES